MPEPLVAVVFDDETADGFAPFSLTRPTGEVRFGRWSARERLERAIGGAVAGHVTRPWLASFQEPGAPPVVARETTRADTPRVLWSSRAILDAPLPVESRANVLIEGRLAGVRLEAGDDGPDEDWFRAPSAIPDIPHVEVAGSWLDAPWDLVSGGPARLLRDLESVQASPEGIPAGVHQLGGAAIHLGDGTTIEPGVLLDVRRGPIFLGDGVEVRAGARLEGPLYAGDHSKLLGGAISVLSAGPFSYLRGEVEEVTTFGYCNKAHDGFLGHAVLGRWVNLGAMTTNSDLKNNYGSVRMGPPDRMVDTGLVKVGCLVGDHVKTGIGVLLNTGTIAGAGSNIYGAELPPKWIPPFSWGEGADLSEYRRDAFLTTAATVMSRRGQPSGDEVMEWLGAVWDEARR